MKKRILLTLLMILSFTTISLGQTTTVTLTVVDSSGAAWSGGVYTATLKPPAGQPPSTFFLNGVALTANQVVVTGSLNTSGVASFALTSNTSITPSLTTWSFQICYQAPNNPCFFSTPFTITGGSQPINLTPPPVQGSVAGGTNVIPCAPQFSSTDTLTAAATSPTDTTFITQCPILAGTIINGVTVKGLVGIDWTATATVPNFTFKVKLCTISGCGSGTVATLYTSAVNAPAAGTFSSVMPFVIQGESAAGATATIAQSIGAGVGTNAPFGRNSNVTNVANVPTNATLFLSFSITFSTNAAGNSITITQLVFG